jgi:hypothetical protein
MFPATVRPELIDIPQRRGVMFFFLGSRANSDAMALRMLIKLLFVTDKVAALCCRARMLISGHE